MNSVSDLSILSERPRPVSPPMRRRALAEPHVRFRWIAGCVLLALATWLLITGCSHWIRSRHLLANGVKLQARIVEANASVLIGKTERGDSAVRIEYAYGGKIYRPAVFSLEGHPLDEPIIVGQWIPIRVDPSQPELWTPRVTPSSLGLELVGGIIMLASAVTVFLFGVWRWRRILQLWRDGELLQGVVLDARHTALVPQGWLIRCKRVDGEDRRLLSAFVPAGCDVRPGRRLWLLLGRRGAEVVSYEWLTGLASPDTEAVG